MTNLIPTFESWKEQGIPAVQLLNKNQVPVAAIYLNRADLSNITITETNTDEKYYIYINGIAILFSSYKKVYKN